MNTVTFYLPNSKIEFYLVESWDNLRSVTFGQISTMMQTEIIPTQDIIQELGTDKLVTELVMKTLGLSTMNEMYTKLSQYEGIELIEEGLKMLQISFEISEEDLAKIPLKGAFISISNHPYGILDGVLLLQLIKKIRPDFKVTANHYLEILKPLRDLFIGVITNKEFFNINELDRLLMDIDSKKYKVPVLIRQYIKLNGKIIGFNTDPNFNDGLDGLILVDVMNIPDRVINQLS